jgi:hypothetical protein
MKDDAEQEVRNWENRIRERELAEKRRVAPGYLDSSVRVLVPKKHAASGGEEGVRKDTAHLMDSDGDKHEAGKLGDSLQDVVRREGEELDRAFGGLGLR